MGELRFPTLNVKPPRKFREMVHKYKRLVEGDEDVPESLPSHSTESWIRGKSFRSLRLEGGRLTMHTTDKRADDNLEAILTFSYGVLFRLRTCMCTYASLLDSPEFPTMRRDIHRSLQLVTEALKTEHRALPRQQLLLAKSRMILTLKDAVHDSATWRAEREAERASYMVRVSGSEEGGERMMRGSAVAGTQPERHSVLTINATHRHPTTTAPLPDAPQIQTTESSLASLIPSDRASSPLWIDPRQSYNHRHRLHDNDKDNDHGGDGHHGGGNTQGNAYIQPTSNHHNQSAAQISSSGGGGRRVSESSPERRHRQGYSHSQSQSHTRHVAGSSPERHRVSDGVGGQGAGRGGAGGGGAGAGGSAGAGAGGGAGGSAGGSAGSGGGSAGGGGNASGGVGVPTSLGAPSGAARGSPDNIANNIPKYTNIDPAALAGVSDRGGRIALAAALVGLAEVAELRPKAVKPSAESGKGKGDKSAEGERKAGWRGRGGSPRRLGLRKGAGGRGDSDGGGGEGGGGEKRAVEGVTVNGDVNREKRAEEVSGAVLMGVVPMPVGAVGEVALRGAGWGGEELGGTTTLAAAMAGRPDLANAGAEAVRRAVEVRRARGRGQLRQAVGAGGGVLHGGRGGGEGERQGLSNLAQTALVRAGSKRGGVGVGGGVGAGGGAGGGARGGGGGNGGIIDSGVASASAGVALWESAIKEQDRQHRRSARLARGLPVEQEVDEKAGEELGNSNSNSNHPNALLPGPVAADGTVGLAFRLAVTPRPATGEGAPGNSKKAPTVPGVAGGTHTQRRSARRGGVGAGAGGSGGAGVSAFAAPAHMTHRRASDGRSRDGSPGGSVGGGGSGGSRPGSGRLTGMRPPRDNFGIAWSLSRPLTAHLRLTPLAIPSRVKGSRVRGPTVDPASKLLPREVVQELMSHVRPQLDRGIESMVFETMRLNKVGQSRSVGGEGGGSGGE